MNVIPFIFTILLILTYSMAATFQGRVLTHRNQKAYMALRGAELDILRYITDDGVYRFSVGPKISLPVEIFGYSLLIYFSRAIKNRRTVAIDDVIYQPGSPGQVFKLDENTIIELIEKLEIFTNGKIRLQETAGLMQIYLDGSLGSDFRSQAMNLLERHYANE